MSGTPEGMSLRVKAPARIHLGIIDMKGDLGRLYGSVGVAVEEPATVVEVEKTSGGLEVEGIHADRAKVFAEKVVGHYRLSGGFRVRVLRAPPRHVGLGSGTQLALTIGVALTRLEGIDAPAEELAVVTGRGGVSGVGTYAFKYGGLVIDGGKRVGSPMSFPPLILRAEFPDDWRFVIGIPDIDRGLSGRAEIEAMERATRNLVARGEHVGEASRVILMKLLPALIERDVAEFGRALSMLQVEVGRMFSSVQGGVFSDPVIAEGVEFLLREGASGAGQSSWGPSFYGLVRDEKAAIRLSKSLRDFLAERTGGEVICTRADNSGAKILRLQHGC